MTIANTEKVKSLVENNELAGAAFQEIRNMGKPRPSNDLYRLRTRINKSTGRNFSLRDLLSVFRQLQTMGLGKVVISTGINPTPSFHWHYKVQDVLKVLYPEESTVSRDKQSLLPGGGKGRTVVPIPVRPGVVVRVEIPAGCTKQDLHYAMSTMMSLEDLFK